MARKRILYFHVSCDFQVMFSVPQSFIKYSRIGFSVVAPRPFHRQMAAAFVVNVVCIIVLPVLSVVLWAGTEFRPGPPMVP
jgi:hypothetical protein